jgi:hypothetical protein
MAKIRGAGGNWVIYTPYMVGVSAATAIVVHMAEYEVLTEVDVRQTRTVGCGGWSEGLPRYRRVEHATFRVAEDDASYPQVLGFTEGAELTTYLRRGALKSYDLITRTIVKSVRREVDQKKAVWVNIACQHGIYQRNVPIPFAVMVP